MNRSSVASTSSSAVPRRYFSRGWRNTLLTAHIIFSVSLLGDSAGFLAVAIRASALGDVAAMRESVSILEMFSRVFGIPLSFATLFTGIALGLGSKWGVLRYPWVVTKLLLIVSVMFVGGFFIGPAQTAILQEGRDATNHLIGAGAYDVLALTAATIFSVFKPGGPFRSRAGK